MRSTCARIAGGILWCALLIQASPIAAPAVTHSAARLYVSNEKSGSVSVIDTSTNAVISTIAVGGRVRGIRAVPGGHMVMVAISDYAERVQSTQDAIALIDTDLKTVIKRYDGGSDPEQFALAPDGSRMYTSNEDAGTATVVDLRGPRVLASLTVGIEPEGVAVSPDGRWVYITAETSNTVSVIDARREKVAASFLVDPRPRAAAFSPDGLRAFVTSEIGGTLTEVDARRHVPLRTIDLPEGAHPVGVVVSPDGTRVYVANGRANSVSIVDPALGRVIATVPVGQRPWGIGITPDGSHVYTANGLSNDVSVIDTHTRKTVATIRVQVGPWGVAVSR